MKKVLLTFLVVIVVLVGGALAAPSFVDWNAYKDDLRLVVKEQTGRDLVIEGDIKARLIPSPEISAEDIRLSNSAGSASEDMLSLKAVRVKVAIAPLLSKIVRIDSFELVEPIVEVEKRADGSMNFDDLSGGGNATVAPAAAPAGSAGTSSQNEPISVAGFDVSVDSATIRNGTLIYRDTQAGSMQVIENFNLTVGANSLVGPYDLSGDISLLGIPLAFEAGLGEVSFERAAVPLTLSVDVDGGATRTNFTGALVGLPDNPGVRGKLKGRSENILKLMTALGAGDGLPAELAKPLSLDASLNASATEVKAEDIAFEAAGSRITGSARVALGEMIDGGIDLHVARLDLDALLASLPAQPAAGDNTAKATDSNAPASTPAQSAGKPADTAVPELPKNVNFAATFTADAIVYRGKPVNKATASVALANGELSINQISAQLPGGSDVAVFGFIAPRGKSLGMEIEADARSDNLRALLDWAGVDLSAMPKGKLQTMALRTKVGGTTENIQITDLNLKLDSTTVRAAATLRPGDRPAAGITLRVDRLDLDGYIPASSPSPAKPAAAPATAANGSTPATAPASSSFPFAGLKALNDFDVSTDVEIATLTHNGITANKLALRARLVKGKLDLTEFSVGNLAGAAARVSGSFANFGATPSISALDAGLSANSIDGLLRLAGIQSPIPPEKLGAITARVTADGDLNKLQVSAKVTAAGGTATATGPISPLAAVDDLRLAVTLDHPSLNRLLEVVAPDYRPTGRNLGPLAVKAGVGVKPDAIAVDDLNARVGPVSVAGNASVATGGARPMITARLSANELPAQLFAPLVGGTKPAPAQRSTAASGGASAPAAAGGSRWSREKLDVSGLKSVDADVQISAKAVLYEPYRVDNPEIILTLNNGRLDLKRMAGKMFGGGFDMTAVAVATDKLTVETATKVENANIKKAILQTAGMDVADGTLNFTSNMKTTGLSEYDLIRNLNGTANLAVTDGLVNGFDLDALSDKLNNPVNVAGLLSLVTQGISGGQTRFQDLKGTFRATNGVVETNDLKVTAKSGTATTVAKADLADWKMNGSSVVQLTRIDGAPPINVRFSGPLDQPNPTFDINAFQAFMLANGLVKGVGGLVKDGKDIVKGAGGGVGGVVKGILGTLGGQQQQTTPQTQQPSSSSGTATPPPQQQQQDNNPLNNLLRGVLGN